ncbi:MAG: hypothetical protein OEZ06_16050 [Myxococcales bacterium]|nr:hypothetical protein [Myxococcales bacterium]
MRRALAQYDLNGGTVQVLRELGQRIEGASGHERAELSFLRAAVSADLAIISAVRGDENLASQLAGVFGVEEAELYRTIFAELRAAPGSYGLAGRHIADALAVLKAPTMAKTAQLSGSHGSLLRLLSLLHALERTGDVPVVLQQFAAVRCAIDAECPAQAAGYRQRDAQALEGLRQAAAAVAELRQAASHNDPLSDALAPDLDAMFRRLRAISLRPVPRLDPALGLPAAAGALAGQPGLVIVVDAEGVSYGFAPRLQLDPRGEIVDSAPEPKLATPARVDFGRADGAHMRPIEALTTLIERALMLDPALVVGVGAVGGTDASLLGRVLLSVQASGRDDALLLSRDGAGFARGTPVGFVLHRQKKGDPNAAPLRLRVRLGGYSLHRGDDYRDIPRVRAGESLHFDLVTLDAILAESREPVADISFMSGVGADNLAAALFRVAHGQRAVRLVLPQ